jgi:hypothetical protein
MSRPQLATLATGFAILVALAFGVLECLALCRSRLMDQFQGPQRHLRRR